jgi:hypothetical protein
MNVVAAVKVLRLPRPQLSAAAAAFEDDRDVEVSAGASRVLRFDLSR